MPVYKHDRVIFIHIPKTGGTTVYSYFTDRPNPRVLTPKRGHDTFRELSAHHEFGDLMRDPTYLKLTIVRNPYHRLLSWLFFHGTMNAEYGLPPDFNILYNTHEEKYGAILQAARQFLTSKTYLDDHRRLSQFEFLADASGRLAPDLHVLKTESLNDGMAALGFVDFPSYGRRNERRVSIDYDEFIYGQLKDMIYEYYKRDFLEFGYKP